MARKWIVLIAAVFIAACGGGGVREPVVKDPGVDAMERGMAMLRAGCPDSAMATFSEAHEKYVGMGLPLGAAAALNNMGNVLRGLGRVDEALPLYREAAGFFRAGGDPDGERTALTNMAAALVAAGRITEAKAGLDRAENAGKTGPGMETLRVRALAALAEGKAADAEKLLIAAFEAAGKAKVRPLAELFHTQGRVLREMKQLDEAFAAFESALQEDQLTQNRIGIALDLLDLGKTALLSNRPDEAVFYLKQSVMALALLGMQDAAESAAERLKQAAGEAGADTKVTEEFVEKWLNGEKLTNPC